MSVTPEGGKVSHVAPRKEWFTLSSPIGVIGGFTALSEISMVVAAVMTGGGIQIMMTIFACIFPIGIAAAFFFVLWHRPEVLYPPREYGSTSVDDFARAMRGRSAEFTDEQLATRIDASVRTSLESVGTDALQSLSPTDDGSLTSFEVSPSQEGQLEKLNAYLDRIAATAADRVQGELFITLNVPEDGRWLGGNRRMLYNPGMLASHFVTESAYESLAHHQVSVQDIAREAELYGKTWSWKDVETGEVLSEMGDVWARDNQGIMMDARTIESVGIRPGMKLERVELN